MYYAEDTGKVLDKYLEKKKISQAELSRMTGVSENTLSDIRSGKTIPNGVTIDAICRGIGVTVPQFYSCSFELVTKENDGEIVISVSVPDAKFRPAVFAYIESLNSFIHNLTDPSI